MNRLAADALPTAYRRPQRPMAGWARLESAIVAGLRWVAGTAAFAGVVYTIVALPGLVE